MKKGYQIVTRAARESAAVIEQFCQANGQLLLPLVSLIQSASQVVETVIHEIGVRTLETILVLSRGSGGAAPAGKSARGGAALRFAAGSHPAGRPPGEAEAAALAA